MKKALTIIYTYILFCVFCTAVLAAVFMFNVDIFSYVADVPSKLFSLDAFLYGLAVSFPLSNSFALFAVILLMIKRPGKQFLSLIFYLAIGSAAWLFLIPFSLSSLKNLESKKTNEILRENTTSAGIFVSTKTVSFIIPASRKREMPTESLLIRPVFLEKKAKSQVFIIPR